MNLQRETVRSRYTAQDEAFLNPLGFEGAINGTSFMQCRRLKSGRFVNGEPRRYIQFLGVGWLATVTNGYAQPLWRSGPFPDPITCYVNAELVQWKD